MTFIAPKSIIIVGSGVFGLGTAEALVRRSAFANTTITVVDRGSGTSDDDDGAAAAGEGQVNSADFPARDAASIDSSRIVRADYADAAYAELAAEAQELWRGNVRRPNADGSSHTDNTDNDDDDYIGAAGRYTESGLIVVGDNPEPAKDGAAKKKTGMDYVRESWVNVQAIAARQPDRNYNLRELPSPDAIRAAMGTGGTLGDWGYFNSASGWADAEASMAWVLAQVQRTGRVRFVRGRVVRLETADSDNGDNGDNEAAAAITGVRLADGRHLSAELTIAAAGAWTEGLLSGDSDHSSNSKAGGHRPSTKKLPLIATGQVLGYVPITSTDEHARLAAMPVVLNLTSGLFVIPPPPGARELKVARHAYGYLNPTATTTSTPLTHLSKVVDGAPTAATAIPPEGEAALRRALRQIVPLQGSDLADRPFSRTRLCWYTDTPTGDFVVDYHPHRAGLFVATGGSGHGFKFLPVLGDKIVDCVMRQPPEAFRTKWAWREQDADAAAATIGTEDGTRSGSHGLILRDQFDNA